MLVQGNRPTSLESRLRKAPPVVIKKISRLRMH